MKNSYTINKSVFKEERQIFLKKLKKEIDIRIIVPENYSSKYFQSISL